MRIGIWIDDDKPLPDVLAAIEDAAERGFARAWLAQRFGWDALTVLAAVGDRAPEIELGTAIVTTYPRHPMALAGQALTVGVATGGRLSLGIGPSHRVLMEGAFGYPWDRPALHTREYLDVLLPLLRGEPVEVHGETVTAVGEVSAPAASAPPVLLSALGPVMLRLAGERTEGTITAWTGPRGLDEHVVPLIMRAAAGRPAPQVVAGVAAVVTADVEGARRWVAERFGRAGELPSYRAVLDRQGIARAEDTVLIGDEAVMEKELRRYADAGATEFQLCPVGPEKDQARTIDLFGDLARIS